MYEEVYGRKEERIDILKYLTQVKKKDGQMVKNSEREEAIHPVSSE